MRASHFMALLIALALAGWLTSPNWWPRVAGALGLDPFQSAEAVERAPAPDGEQAAAAVDETPSDAVGPMPSVRVYRSTAMATPIEIALDGRTAPAREVSVRAETAGRVVEVLAERGAMVEAGQTIVKLDEQDMRARLAEAQALARQRELEYEAARKLGSQGFQAETNVAAALAGLRRARAQLERAQLELRRTEIEAPFGGVLEERPVEIGDFVDRGAMAAKVVEQDPFLVVGDAIEDDAIRIRRGMAGIATLLDGRELEGEVRYVASTADPSTRTFAVELEIANPDGRFQAGASASMRLVVDEVDAHELPVSVMTIDDRGRLGVKLVGADDIVSFAPAQVVRSEAERIWLAGLPPAADVIVVGQGFVRDGQIVRPSRIEASDELAALR